MFKSHQGQISSIRDKVSRGRTIILAAILIVSGFFIFNYVLAAHTTTSTVDRVLVKGGTTNPYTFTVHNDGADSVYKITINAAAGFIINPLTIVCPPSWNNDGSSSASAAVCLTDVFDPNVLPSGSNANITFQATSPFSNAPLAWNVVTRDVNAGFTFPADNNAVTTVDSLAPTVTAELADSNLIAGETAIVTFTFSEVPTGFTADDVTVEHGSIGAVAGTGNPLVFTATLTPTADVEEITNVITVGTDWTDPAGNAPAGTTSSANYTIDSIVPTITATAPATDTFIKTQTVSYTLSEAAAAASGVITFTRSSGTDDGNSPHSCILQGSALNSGAHTITLETGADACVLWANPLVDGSIYTVTFNASDAAGNPATMVTNTGVTYDITVPTLTTVTIASNNANPIWAKTDDTVTLTIVASENLTSKPTVTIATHAIDAGNVVQGINAQNWTATYVMTGDDVEDVVPFTINFIDIATNPGIEVIVKTGGSDVTFDKTPPTAPTAVTFTTTGGTVIANTVNTTNTNFTGGATITADQSVGGYAELLKGGNPFPTPVRDNAIAGGEASVSFDAELTTNGQVQTQIAAGGTLSVRLYDAAGNYTDSTEANPTITTDYVVPTIIATAPATNAFIKTQTVSYTLSEAAVAASGVITFTRTGGTDDGTSPHTCVLQGTALDSGAHTDLVLATNANACVSWANPLVDGSIYTVTFNASDAAGNPATQVLNSGVTYDTTVPTLTTVTIASNNANNTALAKVGDIITLTFVASENLTVNPVVTIRGQAATIHAGGNAQQWTATYVMDSGDAEGVVPFTINFTDIATNAGVERTTVTDTSSVTFDKTAPTAPTSVTFTTTGGTVVANTVNTTNTNFTGGATITAGQATGGVAHWLIGDAPFTTPINDADILIDDGSVAFDAGLASNVGVQAQIASGARTLSVQLCDAAGNCSTSSGGDNKAITADYVVPTITATAPAASTSIKAQKVSYTLSEAAVAASGVIVFTRTAGTADGNVHSCVLQGTALEVGAHTDLVLATDANACVSWANSLVSGTIYTVTFNASDAAGNPATAVTNTSVTYDTTAPTAAITYSDPDGIVKSGDSLTITATFNEPMADAPIVKIAISGSNTVAATEMTKTSATVYTYVHTVGTGNGAATVALSVGTDVAGNVITAAPTSGATFTVDNIAPSAPTTVTFTAVGGTVITNKVNTTNTNFTGGATITAGQAAGGYAELLIGGASFPTPVRDNTIAGGETSVSFNAGLTTNGQVQTQIAAGGTLSVRLYDVAGNYTDSAVANPIITTDYVVPTITATAPATNAFIKTQKVSYTLSEAAVAASGVIVFTRTAGTADGNVHTCTLQGTALASGDHTDLTLATNANACVSWATSLINGSIYTVTFNARDAAGNPATAVTNTSVTYDTTAPTAAITYSITHAVKSGDSLTITATFNEPMANAPIVKIAISGSNTVAATEMTKTSATVYTYVHTVGTGDGTATVALSVGTDVAGNVITAAPTSGATFTVDNTPPNNQSAVFTSSVTKKGSASVTIVSSGNTTNDVWFAPSGTTVFVAGPTMTKATNGVATTILAPATEGAYKLFVIDVAGNISAESIATLTVDNTAPTADITYSITHAVKSGNSLTITATYNEPLLDSPVVKIAISGSDTVVATNMTKVDTTHYTYVRTVGTGNGPATVALSVGTDVAGNVITAAPTSGATFTVDNIAPIISSLTPSNGSHTSDTTPTISAAFEEDGSEVNVSSVVIRVDGTNVTVFATITANDVSYTPASSMTDGIHTMMVDATDIAGNVATQASWQFEVASTITTVTAATDKSNVLADGTTQAKLTAQVLDNDVPVTSGNVAFNTTIGTLTLSSAPLDGSGRAVTYISSTETGETTITASFNSGSGLVSGTVKVNFTKVDTEAPVATQWPSDGSTGVAIDAEPYIDFSEAMDETTLTSDNIQLREYDSAAGIPATLIASTNGDGTTRVTIVPGSDLTSETQYYFFISAAVKDLSDNSIAPAWTVSNKSNHEFKTLAEEATSYDISLSVGWNLISLPLIPSTSTIGTLLTDISSDVNIVKYYDAVTGNWLSYVPTTGGTLTTMEDGKGYWIFMNAPRTLTVSGIEMPGPGEILPSYPVITGWNMIGFKSVTPMKTSQYLAGLLYTILYNGIYSTIAHPASSIDNDMLSGLGYWLYANAAGDIVPPLLGR